MRIFIAIYLIVISFLSQIYSADDGIDCEIPSIKIFGPKIGETLFHHTTYILRWNSNDNTGVTAWSIYLSTDGRKTWTLIDSSNTIRNTYSWLVPPKISRECVIKIFAYDAAGNMCSDETVGEFSIAPASPEMEQLQVVSKNRTLIFRDNRISCLVNIAVPDDHLITISTANGTEVISFQGTGQSQWYRIPVGLTKGMHIITTRSHEKTILKKAYFAL